MQTLCERCGRALKKRDRTSTHAYEVAFSLGREEGQGGSKGMNVPTDQL